MTQNTRKENKISAELCEKIRRKRRDGYTYKALAEETGLTIKQTIEYAKGKKKVEGCEVEPVEKDHPWREREVMKALFIDENMYFKSMGKLIGCHDETARNWVKDHNLSEEETHHTSSKTVRKLQLIEVDPFARLKDENEEEESENVVDKKN